MKQIASPQPGMGAGGLVGLAGVVPGIFEGFVGGHGRQDCCCWLRVGRVGVAPPKHGFHASGQAHAAVVAQHLAQARVRAFDLVGHRGHLMCPGGVQVREQESLGDELVEAVTSPNETFVGVFPPSVRSACFLLQEALPARTPPLVGAYPFLSVINVVHAGELASKTRTSYARPPVWGVLWWLGGYGNTRGRYSVARAW